MDDGYGRWSHLPWGVSSLKARGECALLWPIPVMALEPCQGREARLLGPRAPWGWVGGRPCAVQQGGKWAVLWEALEVGLGKATFL